MDRLKTPSSRTQARPEYTTLNLVDESEEKITIPKSMVLELVHEVRNPLTLIKSTVQMVNLKLKGLDTRYFDNISKEVDRINRILEEFVTLARSQKYRENINLAAMLREVCHLLEGESQMRNIAINMQLAPGDVWIDGYPDQFKQVLLNLARNGMEAMQRGGNLTFVLKIITGNIAQIQIQDTGTGIQADILEQVFEPYFTTKKEGTGLGLAICKRIVQEHNGDIYVKNNTDRGCTFYINLPVIEALSFKNVSNG